MSSFEHRTGYYSSWHWECTSLHLSKTLLVSLDLMLRPSPASVRIKSSCKVRRKCDLSLAFSNHHLEYGFPSTHSTNSISIALFIYTHVHRLASLPAPSTNLITTLAPPSDWSISPTTYWISTVFLAWYTFSIIYGRLYCAMHSFSDCALGAMMGAVIWAIYWVTEDAVENWLIHAGWSGQSHVYLSRNRFLYKIP
jgi:membrane-associated phospholipid phosphatase